MRTRRSSGRLASAPRQLRQGQAAWPIAVLALGGDFSGAGSRICARAAHKNCVRLVILRGRRTRYR
jgi:hypothetical protein